MDKQVAANRTGANMYSHRLEEIAEEITNIAGEVNVRFIQIGGKLCEARALFPADQEFGEWRTRVLPGLHVKTAEKWMNAFRNGGFELAQHSVGESAICLLTAPSVPGSAREEAVVRKDAGEGITAKQAKEIAQLHKEIEAQKKLEANRKPSLSNLVPELAKMVRAGSIPETTALEFSKVDSNIQRMVIAPKFQQVSAQQKEIDRLKEEKTRALERESKEREARESLQADYDSAVEQGAQAVIAEKDKEIKRKEKELEQFKVDFREEIERNHTAMIEKRVRAEWQAKLDEERRQKEKAEREAKQQKERAQGLVDDLRAVEHRAKNAESALKATHPIEKDAEHARAVGFLAQDLKSKIKKLESDCEPHQRKLTDEALYEIQAIVTAYFGSQDLIEMEN